jgi:hypothetical protein
MTTIELKYDAFTLKTVLAVNGTERGLRCFGTGRETLLREWADGFFPELVKSCNLGPGAECAVQFYGTQSDFEDVTAAYNEYLKTSEDDTIKLLPCKPYPNNFTEINELIAKKKDEYTAQIERKERELANPESRENAVAAADMEKQFSNDKRRLDGIISENREHALSILAKAGEGFALLPAAELEDIYGETREQALSILAKTVEVHAPLAATVLGVMNQALNGEQFVTADKVKAVYGRVKECIVSAFEKNCADLKELFASLFEKQDAALHSEYETVCDTYAANYPGLPVSLYRLQKRGASPSFVDDEPLPASCLGGLKIDNVSPTVTFGKAAVEKALEKARKGCQEYMAALFETARQRFMAETEKCEAYYADGLSELQKAAREKVLSSAAVEQELLALKTKLECLGELQIEINKLVTA